MTWDTVALIGRAHQGDKEARDILFHENTGLIYSVAHRFLGRGAEMEDLFQIGSIGLLKAVDKFDLSYDVKFSTYAVPMIAGEIKRFLRDDGMLKVSRSIKENQYRIYKMREKLEKNLGREPTVTELAEELGMTPEEIAMASDAATEVESIYRPNISTNTARYRTILARRINIGNTFRISASAIAQHPTKIPPNSPNIPRNMERPGKWTSKI